MPRRGPCSDGPHDLQELFTGFTVPVGEDPSGDLSDIPARPSPGSAGIGSAYLDRDEEIPRRFRQARTGSNGTDAYAAICTKYYVDFMKRRGDDTDGGEHKK